MGMFAYIARDTGGKQVTGTLAGPTRQIVLAELQSRSLAPVSVREVHEQQLMKRRISLRQRSIAYRQLSDLLRAGVPLLRALRILGRSKAFPRLARIMSKVADNVADGSRFADAMTDRGEVFPIMEIAMIRAGERGGFLEPVLVRLGIFLEKQADMKGKVIGNLVYPVVLLTVGFIIIAVFLIFVVPKFRDFYSRIELPLPTRMILGGSDVLASYWMFVLGALAFVIGLWFWLRNRMDFRRETERLLLRIPKYGPLRQSIAVARFTRILGTLLGNGVPMLTAMKISRDAAGQILLAEAIDEATIAIEAGQTLTGPLARSGMLGEEVIEMISVGESANNLPDVLITIADTIDKRIDRLLTILMRLMEPLLLMMLGGAVFFMFVALIVPMLRMSSSI